MATADGERATRLVPRWSRRGASYGDGFRFKLMLKVPKLFRCLLAFVGEQGVKHAVREAAVCLLRGESRLLQVREGR
jgi:hypothetical protein